MGADKYVFGSLLLAAAMSAGGAARAMEPATAATAPSSSAFSMPSFFDGNRLPDLKEAWRTRDPAPASTSTETTPPAPPANDDAALAAAKAAMLRAEEAGREAAEIGRAHV